MPDLRYHPELPKSLPESGFLQTITLMQNDKPIGIARWHAMAGGEGVVQLVDMLIDPNHRRQNHGSTLMLAVIEQARGYHKLGPERLRRFWIQVQQKTQVNARAYLGRHGFHHISTIGNLHRKQDGLFYMKTFD